ncbi:MAG: PilZ domain-containing protein [Desulfobacterales bacterium]|jgi:hypothetical protein
MARIVRNEKSIAAVTAKIIDIILKMPFEQRCRLLDDLERIQSLNTRKHERKSCLMNVQYLVGGKLFNGFINNISAGGVFIECPKHVLEKLESGLPVTLTFEFPDQNTHHKTTGQIQRISDSGMGVSFNGLLAQKVLSAA